jgi:hypothetical protein
MNSSEQDPDEMAKLWNYCAKWLLTACEKFISNGENE